MLLLAAAISSAQTLLTSVTTGSYPISLAVNPVTNKIYVVNQNSNNVTVIDGVTNNTATVAVGAAPDAIAVNAVTNKIYVANANASTVTVIDGVTNHTSTISTGTGPVALAVNPVTNKIYTANYNASSVTAIDGATNNTSTISVGARPFAVAVNSVANQVLVADSGSGDVAIIDGVSNTLITRITVGVNPHAIAVNPVTDQIYAANFHSGTVSAIDRVTYAVTTVMAGTYPASLAVDSVRNQIFVANSGSSFATVIDGATLSTNAITTGASPVTVDVDAVTGKAYFANNDYQGTLTMFDENSGATTSTLLGGSASSLAVNTVSNRVYVVVPSNNQMSVLAGGNAAPLQFVPVTPCRVVDTRQPLGPFGGPYISGGIPRSFAVPQSACGIPNTALAYALNVTVVPLTRSLGYLTIWSTGEPQPLVSTMNSPDGRTKANAAIVPSGAQGAVSVYVTDSAEVILDIDGYFQPAMEQSLQFYPVPLCRAFDTRGVNGALGGPSLQGGHERDFPVLASNCALPANALAYSMNFTVVPVAGRPLGYLTVWAAGSPQPVVSTLNNPTATTLANAAFVPAGAAGAIAVFADQDTQLIGDLNGYFAAPASGGLSLYPLAPCRVLDTRSSGGAFSGQRSPPINVLASACGIPAGAQEYVFNATVVPVGSLGYLTLWADGDPMPGVSTLNATDGVTASNMAIIGNRDGKADAYAYGTTQLILDIASYFAP